MEIYWKLKHLGTLLLSALLPGIVFVTVGLFSPHTAPGPALDTTDTVSVRSAVSVSSDETNGLNPDPPDEAVKLVFIHHSVGANWLQDGYGNLGVALGDNQYYVSETYYGWGPDTIGDHTDIGRWWDWFRGENSITYTNALYTTTSQYTTYTRPMGDPGGENEIIMFKSCFPNSNLRGNPDDPPTVGDNPLRGRESSSSYHTVGNAKGIYNDILEYFETRQDKLFVVITAPPRRDDTYADNARAFNNWLMHDWLADYPYHNVAVFDFYNVLTTNGGDAYTNDYGLLTGNHHRVVTTTTPIIIEHITDGDDDDSPNVLEYPTKDGTNDHPSAAGHQKAMGEFVPLLNIYYNCWKHGDCWDDAADWISVTAANDVASIYPGETAAYTISLTASEGFTTPVTLTLQGAPAGAAASFVPNPITPPDASQLHITSATSTAAGTYAMTVTGTSGQVTDTASLTLTINPTLTLIVQPDLHAILPGNTVVYTLSLTASEGFTAPVTLALQGAPAGADVSFVPNPVAPPGSSQLHITTTTSTVVGTYVMTVTGTSGDVSSTAHLTLTVNPVLNLIAQPSVRTILPGDTAAYTLSVTASEGFAAPVSFTLQGAPLDTSVSFDPDAIIPPGTSQLHITTTVLTTSGIYAMAVTGASGALTDTTQLTLIVPSASPTSFNLSVSPTIRIAKPDQVVSYTAIITHTDGLSQPVMLAVVDLPAGVEAAWSANPVTPSSSSVLTLSIASAPTFGEYLLQVVGTAETQTVTESVGLIVDYPVKGYLPIVMRQTQQLTETRSRLYLWNLLMRLFRYIVPLTDGQNTSGVSFCQSV